jgi:uncharacterized membrane protein YfcA
LTILLILLAASILGGAANALAGGGTFLTFPALLLGKMAPVRANATASLVLLPGAFASAWVYRDTIQTSTSRKFLWLMLGASLVGSLAGSVLLMITSNATFSRLVPWLLLAATAVFSLAPRLRQWAIRAAAGAGFSHESLPKLLVGQVIISAYGGYFGAGMGVLMIALYLVATNLDVHAASGMRMICSCAINTLAVVIFAARGALDYKVGIPMLFAGVVGGYIGAHLVKRLDAKLARRAILIYAWALTAWFFGRMLLGR